ncbi:unnamed protein product [Caenorhabditis bovis]|uniref:Uncharacterized protein n=1 Tax=Caenorhabditis bovis TaxID=2654633 RepID=A0A8S1EMV4_9PELO|nr:unnamed protein product [Caenorhabditis bovis]
MDQDGVFPNYGVDQYLPNVSEAAFIEEKKGVLKCTETLGEKDPIPEISLNFEEAWSKDRKSNALFESKFKTIPLTKEDISIINTMSNCSPDDVAKLIRGVQNSVYLLGLEEARQCRRGKILGVLSDEEEQKTPPK